MSYIIAIIVNGTGIIVFIVGIVVAVVIAVVIASVVWQVFGLRIVTIWISIIGI